MAHEKYLPTVILMLVLGISFSMNLSSESSHITDVIHPHSTVITDVGIATPKIAEIRMVDPGNASDIQAKINDCPSGGCRIYIPAGNYTITNTIVINGSRDNIILTGAASGHPKTGGGTVFIHGTDNINVINITGNSTNMVNNILIENIYFRGYYSKRGYVIYAENVSELKLIGNFFYSFNDSAVVLKNTNLFADHNSFWFCGNNVDKSFEIEYLDAPFNNNTFAVIVYNEFELEDKQYGSISTEYANSSYIAGNIIEGGIYGIRAGRNARVIGNYFWIPRDKGITSIHADVLIEGNVISMGTRGNVTMGISASGGTITGNNIGKGKYGGIWINGSQARVIGNRIGGSGNGSALTGGIVLINSNHSVVSGNVVRGGASGSSGIVIRGVASNNVITGNLITNFAYGVYESVNSGYGNNTIVNNNVINNTNKIVTNGSNTEIYKNMGYLTENGGVASNIVSGSPIAHGLASTPIFVKLTPTAYNITAYLMDKNSTHIQVGLYYTTTGGNVTSGSPTNVSWYAEV